METANTAGTTEEYAKWRNRLVIKETAARADLVLVLDLDLVLEATETATRLKKADTLDPKQKMDMQA